MLSILYMFEKPHELVTSMYCSNSFHVLISRKFQISLLRNHRKGKVIELYVSFNFNKIVI